MNHLKLQIPQSNIRPLPRPHLTAQLDEVFVQHRCLVLVTAPAGFGKTTLVANWASTQSNVSWLSLDVEDNDAMAFLQHLAEAVRKAVPGAGQEALEMLRSPQPPSHLVVLSALLHDLTQRSHPLYVVLDDYHVISASPVRELINYLLDVMPSSLCLVILSRSDPPVNLPRLRMKNALIELKTEDLRFTPAEVESFLRDSMRITPTAEELAFLNTRLEGWPAGLQMAALALKGRADGIDFLHDFSGSSHYILDYLAEAVFERQEKRIQNFLMKTCVLNAINAPLAGTVLETRPLNGYEDAGAGSAALDCQKVLEELYLSHLFVEGLDEQQTWFRYHPLFSDLLRTRLHVIDHSAFKELYTQAAAWFQHNGYPLEAINHAMMAEDEPQTMVLFERHATDLLMQGNLSALGRWMNMLTTSDIQSRPWLCIAQAWVMVFSGRLSGLNELLEQAEHLKNQAGEAWEISAHIAVVRSFMAAMTGNLPGAVKSSKAAARQLKPADHWVYAMHQWVLGTVARMQGRFEASAQAFAAMLRTGLAIDNMWTVVTAATEQGFIHAVQGEFEQARRVFEDSLKRAEDGRIQNFGCVSRLKTALANIRYEQGHLEAAMSLVEDAIEGNRFWKNPNHLVYAYTTRARIQLGGGDFIGAKESLQLADQEMRGLPVMGVVTALLDSVKVQLWLAIGDIPAAADWLAQNATTVMPKKTRPQKKLGLYQEDVEIDQISAARIMLAQKHVEEALELLNQLEEAAAAGARWRAVLQIMVLRASALDAVGQTQAAVDVLDNALRLASAQGAVRVFMDEGPAIERLLKITAKTEREGSDDAVRLLSMYAAPKPTIRVRNVLAPAREKRQPAVQPLSQREKEVLNLIAAGMTNYQIATQLVISTGTVKAHSANIYRKLAAGNRVQAVERARALNLLG
jgi:LuxR family transcriptional regulator, maltose regulon positive regulatory protein